MNHDQRWTVNPSDHLRHCVGLPRTSDPQKHLMVITSHQSIGQFLDCARLIAPRFKVTDEFELTVGGRQLSSWGDQNVSNLPFPNEADVKATTPELTTSFLRVAISASLTS